LLRYKFANKNKNFSPYLDSKDIKKVGNIYLKTGIKKEL
jgi:hypothetical protein